MRIYTIGLLLLLGGAPAAAQQLPQGWQAQNVTPVGYADLEGRPAFKLAIKEHQGRWYLFTAHFWHRGWSVLDVTDPAQPQVVRFLEGPANTFTGQVDLHGNLMITALEKILPGFGGDTTQPHSEGVWLWDISDPKRPVRRGHYKTGGTGTHRNFYGGGRYMHLAAGMPGYSGNIYVIVDVSDPAKPVEAGRWWVPGQEQPDTAQKSPTTQLSPCGTDAEVSLHGPPYVVGATAYLPYGSAGLIILDISDVRQPRQVGRLDFSPPFHDRFGVHGALPLPAKNLVYVNSEDVSYGKGPMHHASIVDISDPTKPKLLSLFPEPHPPAGAPYRDFFSKPGWSGPHNINHLQHNPDVEPQGNLFYIAHFNAGLRIYDVGNPRLVKEIGWFMPPEPTRRLGPMPKGELALQTEDVLVDRRGYIYISDKNQGLWILRRK